MDFYGDCFNNDSETRNGELFFYETFIKPTKGIVFDVGCRADSVFTDFNGEVHYFDPMPEFVERLKSQENKNTVSFFNTFGLSDRKDQLEYYPRYQSFWNRTASCTHDDSANKITLDVKRADEYLSEKSIEKIDFLKIDTEGHELKVLQGFGDWLHKVRIVQFEYGGTYVDTGVKMQEVIDHLKLYGFTLFAYLSPGGIKPFFDYTDHYQYSNIVCFKV